MLHCDECRRMVEDDAVETDYNTYEIWGSPYTKSYSICPYCGSPNLTDELPPLCSCCGDYCTIRYVKTDDEHYYCHNCYTIV